MPQCHIPLLLLLLVFPFCTYAEEEEEEEDDDGAPDLTPDMDTGNPS